MQREIHPTPFEQQTARNYLDIIHDPSFIPDPALELMEHELAPFTGWGPDGDGTTSGLSAARREQLVSQLDDQTLTTLARVAFDMQHSAQLAPSVGRYITATLYP